MLEELSVRNYALIDRATLRFGSGLNVLTGETGAGKSILIDALGLILGEKGNPGSIRTGAEEAEVTAVVRVTDSPEFDEWSRRFDIQEEDGVLLIRRTIKRGGRGSLTVQSLPVTRNALREFAETLVDVHGQHEHQSLFKVATHRQFLDRYAGIEDDVREFGEIFSALNEAGKALAALDEEEGRMAREAEFLRYALDEIEAANLQEGEEEDLTARQAVLARHEELTGFIETALSGTSEGRGGALAKLRETRDSLEKASAIDKELTAVLGRFDDAFFELEDVSDQLRRYREETEYDPDDLARIDERLGRIRGLGKKYGGSTRDVLAYAEEARNRLESHQNRDAERQRMIEERMKLEQDVKKRAAALSTARKRALEGLQEKAESHLAALGLPEARFVVDLDRRKTGEGKAVCGPYGVDDVEFLLSANKGEPPKPLRSVASGGELSRVMLALKTVLAESDTVKTLIFDEIDSGIGGEVARSVGEHLRKLAINKQVFCVTHLASIAVFADNHVKVEKITGDDRTVTAVRSVEGEQRVREIARMLAGDSEGEVSLSHAARLLDEFGSGR